MERRGEHIVPLREVDAPITSGARDIRIQVAIGGAEGTAGAGERAADGA